MKIVKQGFEIIDRESMRPAELIELCGRTCYKSEDKITRESADKFVRMLVKKGHFSVLEHASVAVVVPFDVWFDIKLLPHESIRFMNITQVRPSKADNKRHIVSSNLRAWFEFLKNASGEMADSAALRRLHCLLWLFCLPAYEAYFETVPERRQYDEIDVIHPDDMTEHECLIHQYYTVKLVTNRGVTHELVRHRMAGFSQESTRYVNYGGKDMEFIEPVWDCGELISNNELTGDKVSYHDVFKSACMTSQSYYDDFLEHGWRPEQAREVLPNALKSEIVVTASKKEWEHIFSQRASKEAHPQIKSLMSKLQQELFTE